MSGLNTPLGTSSTRSGGRLGEAMRGRRWRIRTGVQDFRFDVQGSRDRRFEEGDPLATLQGNLGGAACEIVLPEALVEALLQRAPEATSLAALDPHDAALLFEHVMTELIEGFEADTALPVMIQRLERGGSAGANAAWFEIATNDTVHPIALHVQGTRVAEQLTNRLAELDRVGPGVIPGMNVGIGPMKLTREDIDALQSGDEVLLEGASLDRLVGAVLLDERHYWPIMLVDGGIVVDGGLTEAVLAAGRTEPLDAFFIVGVTAEPAAMRRGDRMPLQRVDEKRMVLRLGDRILGRAGLVNVKEGLAVRFFGRDGL